MGEDTPPRGAEAAAAPMCTVGKDTQDPGAQMCRLMCSCLSFLTSVETDAVEWWAGLKKWGEEASALHYGGSECERVRVVQQRLMTGNIKLQHEESLERLMLNMEVL